MMMEYLEMRGSVKVKVDADKTVVGSVLNKLRETEFVDAGYIDIHFEGRVLTVSAEGTISDSYSTRALLAQLQGQLTESSMIGVSSVRWETRVELKYWKPITAKRLDVIDQMVFAQ
jgi:hypothetical protein